MSISFSIITVNYNNRNGLLETANSILTQDYKNFEWLIIDGLSDDGSITALRDLISAENITYDVVSEKDSGCYDAMNKGLDLSTRDYVIFMNSGDCFASPVILSKIRYEIERNLFPDVVYGNYIEAYGNNRFISRKAKHSLYIYFGMYTNHQAIFFKKNTLGKYNIKHDLNYKIAADYDVLSQLSGNGFSIKKIDEYVSVFDMSGLSSTNADVGRLEFHRIRCNRLGVPKVISYIVMKMQSLWFSYREYLCK